MLTLQEALEKDIPIALKGVMPVAAAVVGFALGWLTTILRDIRDRRRAANSLIFVLLRIRMAVKRADPELILKTFNECLTEKFNLGSPGSTPRDEIRAVLAPVIQQETERRLTALLGQYSSALGNFAPYRPVIAYQLNVDDVEKLQAMIQLYFQQTLANPDAKSEASSPAIVNVIKQDAIELTRKNAIHSLAKDLREVATASSIWRRRAMTKAIRHQDHMTTEVLVREIARQLDAAITSQVHKMSGLGGPLPS